MESSLSVEQELRQLNEEIARIKEERSRHPTLYGVQEAAMRIVIRSIRIAAGAIVAGLAIWAGDGVVEVASEPLASLTILKIVRLLFLAWLGLLLAWAAVNIAFGEGPTAEEKEEAITREARERLRQRAIRREWGW